MPFVLLVPLVYLLNALDVVRLGPEGVGAALVVLEVFVIDARGLLAVDEAVDDPRRLNPLVLDEPQEVVLFGCLHLIATIRIAAHAFVDDLCRLHVASAELILDQNAVRIR